LFVRLSQQHELLPLRFAELVTNGNLHPAVAHRPALFSLEQSAGRARIVCTEVEKRAMRDPFIAGLLSFLIPGLGQIYNGRILAGILWLVLTGVSWIGSAGTLGWIVHIIAAYTAYSYAKEHRVRV
jgi:TM2 domain-containing membrane protein YozV